MEGQTISNRTGLLAPREMFIQALNRSLNLQRFKVLYATGNYSAILIPLGLQVRGPGDPPGLQSLPAHDYPGGESPFSDLCRARSPAV